MGNVTIKQIAALAGVSRGTVDRALNGREGVKKEVRERILRIADELGYTPNKAAKALATLHRPLKIGAVMPAAGNPFFEAVKQGLTDACAELSSFGLELIVRQTEGYDAQKQADAIASLAASGIDGLLLAPIDSGCIRDLLKSIQLPVVMFNSALPGAERLCYIGQDYYQSGQTAAGLLALITRGDVRAAVLTGSKQMSGHNDRVRGLSDTLAKYTPRIQISALLENGDDDIRSYELTRDLLRQGQMDALVLTAGGVGGAMRALHEKNRTMPVITYDASPETVSFIQSGAISATICQDPHTQGYQSCRAMFRYLSDGTQPPDIYTDIDIRIRENLESQNRRISEHF